MKVLIVDDESLAILRMKLLLKVFPNVEIVGEAMTGEEAKNKILKLRPDVVFLDVEIGQVTGFDVIDQVAGNGFRPKYIIVSGYSQYAIAAIRSKVDDYLLKPVDLNDLKTALIRVMGSNTLNYASIDASSLKLTAREQTVLSGMLAGKSSKTIASELFLSSHTIDTFRRKILKKLGARNTLELMGRIK